MKVSEIMTRDVRLIELTQTIRDAALLMAEMDAGIMPVREGDRLVGMITDRDMRCGRWPRARDLTQLSGGNGRMRSCTASRMTTPPRWNATWPTSRSAACRCSPATSGWSASSRSAIWR